MLIGCSAQKEFALWQDSFSWIFFVLFQGRKIKGFLSRSDSVIPKRHSSEVIPNEDVKPFWGFGACSPNDVADMLKNQHVQLLF